MRCEETRGAVAQISRNVITATPPSSLMLRREEERKGRRLGQEEVRWLPVGLQLCALSERDTWQPNSAAALGALDDASRQ